MEKYCKLCNTYKDLNDFYLHYTEGKHLIRSSHYCKECIKNNFKDNILEICKELDIPFIQKDWDKLNEYHPNTINIGRYVSKMQLKGFIRFHFEDSAYLNEKNK